MSAREAILNEMTKKRRSPEVKDEESKKIIKIKSESIDYVGWCAYCNTRLVKDAIPVGGRMRRWIEGETEKKMRIPLHVCSEICKKNFIETVSRCDQCKVRVGDDTIPVAGPIKHWIEDEMEKTGMIQYQVCSDECKKKFISARCPQCLHHHPWKQRIVFKDPLTGVVSWFCSIHCTVDRVIQDRASLKRKVKKQKIKQENLIEI